MNIVKVNPDNLYDGSANGLSQATVSNKLGLVFVSGQVDWSADFVVQNSDIAGQADVAFTHLKTVLDAAGSSMEKLLQVRIFVRGEVSEHMQSIAPVLTKYLGEVRPALTGVGVTSLASPEMLIEIEAVAELAD
ncbi:RidA family protein [Agarivorans sp. 1_MG-2023]|uniref:RidA family protein n=1 Tax=Agarivorans sp. 1_MG-2023 TaxID=3062634 RepID=UPI0026E3804E|nr:RidA family protein [Agarivorans sp. 1_MG-2023]MDO6764448.1 RidA family protein [Agarivorans sp. 1_MG-2023]